MAQVGFSCGVALRNELRRLGVSGIALDIDDTLSATGLARHRKMEQLFGRPDELTPEQRLAKYGYVQNVPGWQNNPEATHWMKQAADSPAEHADLEVMDGAVERVDEIHQQIGVAAYVTSRCEGLRPATERWLRRSGFPEATLVTRPAAVPLELGNAWKSGVYVVAYPYVKGCVDDQAAIVAHLPENYRGTVVIIGPGAADAAHPAVRRAQHWNDVARLLLAERSLGAKPPRDRGLN